MGDYSGSTTVDASPQNLFDFLSDVGNLPKYFSSMNSARPGQGEEVVTSATVHGEEVEGRAWFHVDARDRHLAWGSEGPNDYRGHLHVREAGGGSEVEVHLHTVRTGDDRSDVQQGIEDTLRNIKQLVEKQ